MKGESPSGETGNTKTNTTFGTTTIARIDLPNDEGVGGAA